MRYRIKQKVLLVKFLAGLLSLLGLMLFTNPGAAAAKTQDSVKGATSGSAGFINASLGWASDWSTGSLLGLGELTKQLTAPLPPVIRDLPSNVVGSLLGGVGETVSGLLCPPLESLTDILNLPPLTDPLTDLVCNLGDVAGDVAGSLLGDDQGVGETASDILCPPVESLTDILNLPPLTDPLTDRLCNLGIIDISFYTVYKRPDGTLVKRQTNTLVNVPTALNVDDDPLPDLIGRVEVLSLNRFSVIVDRALGEFSTLPVSVEAIIKDPTQGSLPRERINWGYDALNSRAPNRFDSTIRVGQESGGTETFQLTNSVTQPGSKLAIVGGLFDNTPFDRANPIGGRLDYTPVPAETGVTLSIGQRFGATLTTSMPTKLTASAEFVDGNNAQRAKARIDRLPSSLGVELTPQGPDQREVTYAASAPVGRVDVDYRRTQGATITEQGIVHAFDLPTGMTLRQTGARSGEFTTGGGPLGRVDVGYANGEPKFLPDDHPYTNVFSDGTLHSFAGRIDELKSASVDATDGVTAELQLGSDARKPFRALVDTPELTIDGRVSNLPRHINVSYDPAQGHIDYDAHGETIDGIDLDAGQTTPFFGRVSRISAQIKDLPSQASLDFGSDGGGFKLETNNPIGEAQALLTSGPDASLPAGIYGAQVEDLSPRFTAFGRVKGLRLVDVTTGPDDAVTGHVRLASTPLNLRYLKDGLTIDAGLSAIPDDVTVAFDPAAGNVDYHASAGIDTINARIDSDTALFGPVKHIDAAVQRLPQDVTIGFKPASGSGGAFNADPAVGMIEANLTDGGSSVPALPAGHSGVTLKAVPGAFALRGRLFEVSGAAVTSQGSEINAALDTGDLPNGGGRQDLDLDLTINDPDDAVGSDAHIVGFIQDLPNHLTLHQAGGATTYDAGGQTVPLVTLSGDNLPGGSQGDSLDGGLHFVRGRLTDVPSHFEITHNSFTNGITANGGFTRADLEAWDHGPQNAALPEDGRNKLNLSTRDDRLHVHARVFDLKKVLLTEIIGTKVETAFDSAPQPMDIAVDAGTTATAQETDPGPLDLDVTVTSLPLESTFEFGTLLGTKIKWDDTNPGTGGTHVNLNLSSKSVGLHNLGIDLPAQADVCVGGNLDCSPASPLAWAVDGDIWITPNQFIAVTTASGLITVDGKVCLPPTDDDGDTLPFPQGVVYQSCINDTETNRITIDNLRLKDQRLEFMSGDTQNKDEDGDPVEDDLLKLYFKSDGNGLRVDELHVRNDTSDSTTNIIAGDNGRPPMTHTGDHFLGLYDLSGIPSTEFVENRLRCGGLDVEVDLPILGLTDVIPGLAEVFIDICE